MSKNTYSFQIARLINILTILGSVFLFSFFLFRVISGRLDQRFLIPEFGFISFCIWVLYMGSFTVPTQVAVDENHLYLNFLKKTTKIQWDDILEFKQYTKSFPTASFYKGAFYLSSNKLGFPNKLAAISMIKRTPLVFIPTESVDHQHLIEYINEKINHSEDEFSSESIAQ